MAFVTLVGFDASAEISGKASQSILVDTVVITGTRTEKVLSEVPVRTEVVTKQEIRSKNAQDLKDAIEDVPGVLLKKIHGKSGFEAWLQGVNADRVLVLIDGEPVAKSTGSTTDLTQIGTENIERIEIVKGATSALYGSSAMGGVINVITDKDRHGLAYHLSGSGGSFGSQNVSGNDVDLGKLNSQGSLSYSDEQWLSKLFYSYRHSDGFKATSDPWNRQGAEGAKVNIGGKLGLDLSSLANMSMFSEARMHVEATTYNENIATYYSTNAGGKSIRYQKDEETQNNRLALGAHLGLARSSSLKLNWLTESFSNTTQQDAVATAVIDQRRDARIDTGRFSSQWDTAVGDYHFITAGVEYLTEELEQNQTKTDAEEKSLLVEEVSPGSDRSNRVLYVQDDYFVTESLEILPGFRFQNDSDFGNYFAPKINGRIDLSEDISVQHFVRFGIGRGYRVPNLKERYYVFDHSHLGYMVLGNPDLKPEYSNSYQLGWGMTQRGHYQLDVNFFYNDLKDLIETTVDNEASSQQGLLINRYANISRASTSGFELSGVYWWNAVSLIDSNVKFSFGYNYLSAENRETKKKLAKRPENQIKAGLGLAPAFTPLTIDLQANWQSHSYFDQENILKTPAYSTFDIKLNYPLRLGVMLFGGIDNLTNTQKDFLDPHDLRPEEGRYVYLGARWEG